MRFFASLLLLTSSVIVPGALAQNTDEQVTAAWEMTGVCAFYFTKFAKKAPLSQTCIKYCATHGGHGYSECDVSPYKDVDWNNPKGVDKSMIYKDAVGDPYVPCKCKCDNPDVEGLAGAILDIVIKGLAQLDHIICAVMLESFKTIVDIGIEFIPGGQALGAAQKAVEGAKSFVENGLAAADFFGNWVGKACGVPDWNFDLWGALTGAPDSYGKSIGCKKKNIADCKKMDPIPDKPKKNPPPKTVEPPPKTTPKQQNPPKTTPKTQDPPKTTPKTQDPPNTTKDQNKPTTTKDSKPSSATSPKKTTDTSKPTSTNDPKKSTTTDARKSTTTGASQTSSAASSTASSTTDDCAASGTKTSGAGCQPTTPCQVLTNPGLDSTDLRRDTYRSPRHAFRSMVTFDKRDVKSGKPCAASPAYTDWELSSDQFPSNGQLADDVASYGWTIQGSLCDWNWQKGTTRNPAPSAYDSEHVMEWQLVTDFFAKLQAKGATNYKHPDPREKDKAVDFCTYWIESWSLEAGQEFAIGGSGPKLSTWKHISSQYPSTTNEFRKEMIRLENFINQQSKAALFTDTTPMIWTEAAMDKQVKSPKTRDKALRRMRLALGAQKYLTEDKVKEIFKNQKTRMGNILDKLDTEMSQHPREYTDSQGNKLKYNAWQKQDLLKQWNDYMDSKWDAAVAKHKKVMDKWVEGLDDAHCQNKPKKSTGDKQFCDRLNLLKADQKITPAFAKPW